MKKALFIRLDKIGDLILTLPCDHLVADQYEAHWFVPQGLDFVVNSVKGEKNYSTWSKIWSWTNFFALRKKIKEIKPEVSVSFHVPWWVNMALWSCRVKTRGGVQSQWHSYLFLNKGLRQKRSQVESHEMEYNYQLVEHTFNLKRNRERWIPVELEAPAQQEIQFDISQDYFVVHPGMGGSALNWPTTAYAELINELTKSTTVVVTGTKGDDPYLSPLKSALKDNHKVVWLDKQLNGYQLLKLLKNAKANIAPSTGVIHLSASLGAASIGIYSPIKVHQAKRWGPKGKETSTFTPTQGGMENLSVSPVAKKALSYL